MTPTNLIISFLILFCGCAEPTLTEPPPSTSQFGTDETLDIITWNLQNFPKSNSLTVDYLSQLIIELDADIVALQEIGSEYYFNNLINTLDGWEGEHTSGSYGLAYIYKSELTINEIYEIAELDDYNLTRTPFMLELTWKGENIYLINNHYKCCGDGIIGSNSDDEEYRRLQSVKLTKEYIDTYYDDKNIILLGDLNDELDEDAINNVFLDFINNPSQYSFTDMNIAFESSSYWSYPSWPSHLDHILITNELYNNHDTTYTILAENFFSGWAEYDDIISDHRPVGIRLQFGD